MYGLLENKRFHVSVGVGYMVSCEGTSMLHGLSKILSGYGRVVNIYFGVND